MNVGIPQPHLDGMGAIIDPEGRGTGFRVWAPHASKVVVRGDFNEWNSNDRLHDEGNGYWYGFVWGAAPGHEYKFTLTNGDNTFDRVDPYAQQVTNSVGNGVIYDHGSFDWQDDTFVCPPHNELVIYELHVGSFTGADGKAGDLEAVVANLDHFTKVGVNIIQIMPVAEFAGDFSWGYNPAHIFAVESAYGGPDALKTLFLEAHNKGIGVVLDVVYNHFGPSDLNLWTFDGWSEDGKGGIYFFQDWRSATPWGDTRPDYGREEVRRFIHDNALMWLRDYRVDGLRYDMTPYIRSVDGSGFDIPEGWGLMQWINRDVREQFPDAITIAEDLHSENRVTSTAPDGAGFHAQWEARFVHPVREAVIVADDAWRSVAAVADAVAHSYGDAFARVIYTESHDEVANGKARVPQEIDPGDPEGYYAQKRSTLGSGLVFTAPGVPMLFMGQEFLEAGWFRDDVPLDWNLNEEFHGIVRLYRDLVALRRNVRGETAGLTGQGLRIIHANDAANVLAFQRWRDHGPKDDVVIVLNLDATERHGYTIGMPNHGLWKLRFNSDARIYSDRFGDFRSFDTEAHDEPYDGMDAHASIDIAPYTMLIYSQD